MTTDSAPRPELEDLAVIIPAYNEQEGILDTLLELRSAHPEPEIVVVDDGSKDATAERVGEAGDVRLIRHHRNRGYGAALKTAIRSTQRSIVCWYDADGQHRPEDLLEVVRPVLDDECDVVIGARGKDSAQVRDRVAGKWVLKMVAQLLVGEKLPDLNSGLRCFRRDMLLRYLHLLPDGFSASTTSTILTIKRGYRLGYVPIKVKQRVGKSTVRIVSDGLSTLNLIFRLVVLFEALKVFSILGVALIVPGIAYGLYTALTRGQGIPTLAGTVIIAGVLTLFLGVIADQITELRKERFEEPGQR